MQRRLPCFPMRHQRLARAGRCRAPSMRWWLTITGLPSGNMGLQRIRARRADASSKRFAPNTAISVWRCSGASTLKKCWRKSRSRQRNVIGSRPSGAPAFRGSDDAQSRSHRGRRRHQAAQSKGHYTWTDDEIAQYRAYWPIGTQQRLVMEFALETASRRGEVVRLGPQHVKNGWIHIERTHGSDDVDIPVRPELEAACDAMPKAHLTYIVNAQGKPRSKYGLGNDFAKWATQAGLPKRCRLHGLRKAGMRQARGSGQYRTRTDVVLRS